MATQDFQDSRDIINANGFILITDDMDFELSAFATTLPAVITIPNTGNVTYDYTVDPSIPNGASGSATSNTVITNVRQAIIGGSTVPDGSMVKSFTPAMVKQGDTITYTIVLTNIGNVTADNITFQDTIPDGTSLAVGSQDPNPPSSISVGSLAPLASTIVTFEVVVDTLPATGSIPNMAWVNYSYTVDPSIPDGATATGISNTVTTPANQAIIGGGSSTPNGSLVKSFSPAAVKIGDTITYTIDMTNIGNTTANNITFQDTLPAGTTLAATSQNPVPPSSIPVGSLGVGASTSISFQVVVVTLPPTGTLPNQGSVNFTYTADPSVPDGATGTGKTNIVLTPANEAVIDNASGGLVKAVSPSFAKVGDTLTYTITLTNTGNTVANNVYFQDTVPTGTTLAAGSQNPNPPNSIAIGNIQPGASTSFSFQVVVTTIPPGGSIPNTGSVNFTYTKDPFIPGGATGTGITNTVTTPINQAYIDNAKGGLTKTVSPSYAKVGDTLTYVITLTNTGNTTANNIYFQDTVPTGTTLATGSADPNPPSSIPVGSLGAGASTSVSFQVVVLTIPATGSIPNVGSVNFTYTVDPSVPDGVTGTGTSNKVTTPINQASIGGGGSVPDGSMVKTFTPAAVKLGDTITYTVTMTNVGNVTADNIYFQDPLPAGTTLAAGSQNPNPPSSIPVGSLGAGASTSVSFQVVVVTLPPTGSIPNQATVNYSFTVDPSVPDGATGTGTSNKVTTPANEAIIDNASGGMTKVGSPNFVKVGDTLTYTITLTNTGNTTANSIYFQDTIPAGTTLAAGSQNPNPPSSIPLGSLGAGASTSVSFQVVVLTIPAAGSIPNTAGINFTYTKDPSIPDGATGTGSSNTVITPVNQAVIGGGGSVPDGSMVKSFSPAAAKIGDTITFTVSMTNIGNVTANNIYFQDTIPAGTTLAAGSMNPNPPSSIALGSLGAGATTIVSFQVVVVTLPPTGQLSNKASVNYTYSVDPSLPDIPGTGTSTTVTVPVNQAIIDNASGGLVKAASPNFVKVGDTITYTITLTNTGNTVANNVYLQDTIPAGTTLAAGSQNPNPPSSIPVGNIQPGASATVSFQVVVQTIPAGGSIPNTASVNFTYTENPSIPNGATGSGISNTTTTPVSQAIIGGGTTPNPSFVKYASPALVKKGDTLTYSIVFTNIGNTIANNIYFQDTLPVGTSLAPGSQNPNPPSSIPVGNLAPGATTTITFSVIVNTLPPTGSLPNTGSISYTYTVDPSVPNGAVGTGITNKVITPANQAIIGGGTTPDSNLVKYATPDPVKLGDTITYTIVLKNTGNTAANNIYFQDTLPAGTTLAAGSMNPNPPSSIPLGNLAAGATATVTFSVIVNSLPATGTIANTGSINYTYTADPSVPNGATASGVTNKVITNANQAIIDNASGGMTKVSSPQYAQMGDTVTYTITLTNTGNTVANNIYLQDTIPAGTTLAAGSMNPNPPSSIPVGSLQPGASTSVSFQVVVTTIPLTGSIPNTANVKFTYTATPSVPNGGSGTGKSNTAFIKINQAIIGGSTIPSPGFTKAVDYAITDLGNTLTYTIVGKNTGNIDAINVMVTDTVPAETSYISGTVQLNGAPASGDPATGISVGTVAPGGTFTITFKVSVNSIPVGNILYNYGTVNYDYVIDPTLLAGQSYDVTAQSRTAHGVGITNTVQTIVRHGEITPGNAIKTANKAQTTPGDTVTYTITAQNTGNVPINNVIVNDAMPVGASFITGSVMINGASYPAENPNTGIHVGTINAGVTATVSFEVTVLSSAPATLTNMANIDYNYVVNSNDPPVQKTTPTNGATVTVLVPQLTLQKSSNRTGAMIGDTIIYTIVATNTGQITADSVIVRDTLPAGLQYTDNLTVDGMPSGENITTTGVNLGSMTVGAVHTITFSVNVASVPSPTATNTARSTYNYTVSGTTFGGSATSNGTPVRTYSPQLQVTKTSNKQSIAVGGSFIYTIIVKNTGDITINHAMVQDTLPAGFVVNSITVDNAPVAGDLGAGIDIGTINIGQSKFVNVTVAITDAVNVTNYKNVAVVTGQVPTDPNFPPGKTTSTGTDDRGVAVYNPKLVLTKSADKSYVVVGDTVTYTITAKNEGNVNLNNIGLDNVVLSDLLPGQLEFVPGSITINGVIVPEANIMSGIDIGSLAINQVKTITFKAIVLSTEFKTAINQVNGNFSYMLPGEPTQVGNSTSNSYTLNVSNPSLKVEKTSDKEEVMLGDTLTYTVTLTNDGDQTDYNVHFQDELPNQVQLVPGSFKVDGKAVNGVDLAKGITIVSIAPGQVVVITYQVKVVTGNCAGMITNQAKATFEYRLPDGTSGSKTATGEGSSNTVEMTINTFKQMNIESYLTIPTVKPDVEAIDVVTGTIDIVDCHVIETVQSLSTEGQRLTGYKLVVRGMLNVVIDYTALEETQSVHSSHYTVPFSTFVVLPPEYQVGSKLDLEGIVEDMYYKALDTRNFFINATALINVKILSWG